MFSQGGLSLEQAPPISVVLRFFITASVFGLLLGLYLTGSIANLFSLSEHTFQVAVVHLLALGVMASFMLGALFQMLPVLAGVIIQKPTKQAMVVHLLLIAGIVTQFFAFNIGDNKQLFLFSALFLGLGLLFAIFLMLKELLQIQDHSSSSKGIVFSLISFSVAIGMGIYLLLTLGGYTEGSLFVAIKEAHYSFALFGWLTLLIVSVSFQVVEMFYVTPKFPTLMSKHLTVTIFLLLILKTITLFMNLEFNGVNLLLSLLFMLYSLVTLHRLSKRKRPTSDATVWFWRLGMGLLFLSMSIFFVENIISVSKSIEFMGYLSFIGFALSIVFAMIYKIVPFLVWFHLSNQGYMEAPMMHDVIHPKKAKMHFKIHLAVIFVAFLTALFPDVPQGVMVLLPLLLSLSFGWVLYQLLFALKKYNYIQKHTKKMEW